MGAGFESCTCPVGFIALDGLLAGASVPRKPWGKPASCGPAVSSTAWMRFQGC